MTRRLPLVLARLLCVFLPFIVFGQAATAAPLLPTVATATVTKQDSALHYLIEVNGTNFASNTFISLNGVGISTTVVSPTKMQAVFGFGSGTTSVKVGAYTPNAASPLVSNTVAVSIIDAFQLQIVGPTVVRLLYPATYQVAFSSGAPANRAVTWNVNGVPGGNATYGTISAAGVYTPPAAFPASGTATIGVASAVAANVTATLAVPLQNPYPQVSSYSATKVGNTLTYLVDFKGFGYVSGSVIYANGVAQATTFLSPTEIQANVAVPAGTTQLNATISQPNPGAVTSVTYTFTINQAVSVTVNGPATPRLASINTYTASVAGISNTAVYWYVNGVYGGNAQTGTITSTGVYTAPQVQPSSPVSITAVSTAAPTSSGTLALALQNPLPTISSASATQVAGATTFPIDVRGTGFTANSVILANGSAISTTYVSPTEVQGNVVVASGASSVPLTVSNPAPGAGVSSVYTLQLTQVQTTAASASRLLDQSSFGPTVSSIQHVQQVGLSAYLNEQFAMTPTLMNKITTPLSGACAGGNNTYDCAESDVWRLMITSPDQLRQRVAFALSEIFVISMPGVYGANVPSYYNALINDAFGNYSNVMRDVTLSQAMGTYLNMANSGAAATGQIANENFAREMTQLFTVGPYQLNQDGTRNLDATGQPIPTYTQDQIQAFARAYTGWTVTNPDGSLPSRFPNYSADPDLPLSPYEAAHDHSAKQLLSGVTLPAGQTAVQDMNGALADLFAHPNVGPFVCRQLIQHLVTSAPSPAYVSRVAAVFANNGNGVRGDLKAVVTAILMDPEARAGDTNPSVDGGHLREPILLLANIGRAFNWVGTPAGNYGAYALSTNFGERVLASPSVFGYYSPQYVVPGTQLNAPEFGLENTANAVLRMNTLNQIGQDTMSLVTYDQSAFASLAAYPPDLVDTLGALLMHAQMPADMRTIILNAITPITDNTKRVQTAMYLVLNSPQYLIEH